jgi:pilus assembly protein CpaB
VSVPTKKVVVASANLSLGRQLRREDLATLDWPAAAAPEGAFEDPQAIVDRGLIVSVVKNEPILPAKLASKEAGAGLPPIIPPGKRAMSVRVNEVIGVAGYVLPGTRVDVVATANPSSRSEDITTKVVLQNVEVLAAGTRLEQDTPDGKPMQVTVVTLLVTPDESERLTLASTEGKIQLALRNRARCVARA